MNANVDRRVGLPDAPRRLQMLVDSEGRESASGEGSTRISPARGEVDGGAGIFLSEVLKTTRKRPAGRVWVNGAIVGGPELPIGVTRKLSPFGPVNPRQDALSARFVRRSASTQIWRKPTDKHRFRKHNAFKSKEDVRNRAYRRFSGRPLSHIAFALATQHPGLRVSRIPSRLGTQQRRGGWSGRSLSAAEGVGCPWELLIGGFKPSGVGRETGKHGVEEYTPIKSTPIGLGQPASWVA